MKPLFYFTLWLFPFLTSAKDLNCQHSPTVLNCVEYVRNYDGDTITFNIKGVHPLLGDKINVRLYGIDTAEIKTNNKCEKIKGRTAKNLVANLLKNAKRIDLENVQRDKYFRVLADIKYDQKSLSEVLIKNGLAYPYFGSKKPNTDWCHLDRELANTKPKPNDK